MPMKRNVEGLRQNAQKKRQEALDKVERGIRQLLKEGKVVNFNTVSLAAGVSKPFLYKEAEIKARIEHLRTQGSKKAPESRQKASDASKNAIIHSLRTRIKTLEAEVRNLRRQNEVFGGQVLRARDLEQQVNRLQQENEHLRRQPDLSPSQAAQPIEKTTNAVQSFDLEPELAELGVQLNSTIRQVIREAPPSILGAALNSLKQAVAERRANNPSGFFYRAVRDAWQPNEENPAQKTERDLFNEWYPRAHQAGLVRGAMFESDVQWVITTEGERVKFIEILNKYPLEAGVMQKD